MIILRFCWEENGSGNLQFIWGRLAPKPAKMGHEDKNIKSYEDLASPREVKETLPNGLESRISESRRAIENLLNDEDDRKLIIAGPCSIDNTDGTLEYARKLNELQDRVDDKLLLVMRTYFEKPRTSIGWKGLVYDPNLDGSDQIGRGLRETRRFLLELGEQGLPAGTEFLGPLTPQYIGDLISWTAIGARTTESQPHREIASGLSMPVGFKNDTFGKVMNAVNAIKSARNPHSFLGIDQEGRARVVHTKGNEYCHLIMRGGKRGEEYVSNYDENSVSEALNMLREEGLPENIIIDCSHGNSGKDYKKQPGVFREVLELMKEGKVKGVMLESYLKEGNQDLGGELERGVSVTDECMSWETTYGLVEEAYREL